MLCIRESLALGGFPTQSTIFRRLLFLSPSRLLQIKERNRGRTDGSIDTRLNAHSLFLANGLLLQSDHMAFSPHSDGAETFGCCAATEATTLACWLIGSAVLVRRFNQIRIQRPLTLIEPLTGTAEPACLAT